jgi:L-cysteine S-thiosulfotransferase
MQPQLRAADGVGVGAIAAVRERAKLLAILGLALATIGIDGRAAFGAECKRKTAGFFLQDANADGPRRLSVSLQSMPVSLTGALGDPERGREILVNRQKGDCLSCHKVAALASIADQGSIGPVLDGIGGRYNDAQLRQMVVELKAYFPQTIMPSYYKATGSSEASVLTAAEIEDLVAYLKTLK